MKQKLEHTFQVTPSQLAYLKRMAREHDLSGASKALRCLLAFAMAETAQEKSIFETVRCAAPDTCEEKP